MHTKGGFLPRLNAQFSTGVCLLVKIINFVTIVSHDLDNKRAWTTCVQVKGVTLPTGYYFGASAITGNYYFRSGYSQLFKTNSNPPFPNGMASRIDVRLSSFCII